MVVLSLEAYESLTENLEMHLDRADKSAEETSVRLTGDEVFSNVRKRLNNGKV